jgi:protocatechuate 3,4-dioxygenase beta subunit
VLVPVPEEIAGPFPLWEDIATVAQYQRQDITEGKPGVPLNLELSIVNVNGMSVDGGCAPVTDAMVYVWQCDKDGVYSGFDNAVGQTFCRGVQSTDSNGRVRFKTIYPGWYRGRVTHLHVRVYLANRLTATTQLAFPNGITTAVYGTPHYAARGQNTSIASAADDRLFADGTQYQMLSITPNATTVGYDGTITLGIAG